MYLEVSVSRTDGHRAQRAEDVDAGVKPTGGFLEVGLAAAGARTCIQAAN